jgi:transcriptional regulator with XRE-family HTH domain
MSGPATGEAFRFMRKVLGIPAIELAELLDVAPETVSRWENGKLPIERRALALLASMVLDRVEGVTTTLERLRSLRDPPAAPALVRLDLRTI